MSVTVTLDWVSATFKKGDQNERDFIDRFASAHPIVPATPRFGYTEAHSDGRGVLLMWNTDRFEMGCHAQFSGSALRNLFERDGISSKTLLSEVLHAGGGITRLDLAQDAQDEQIDLDDILACIVKGQNKGTSRSWKKWESDGGGYTIYVGSRQSEKFIRIYKKGAEIGTPERDWIRYEIETKGDVARALSQMLHANGDWGSVFRGVATGMLDLPLCHAYQRFFPDGSIAIGLPKIEKLTDREKWIQEQVIAAVATHYIEHPESDAVKRLMTTLEFIKQHGKLDS